MPKYFIYPVFTAVFSLILIAIVPKKEIHRLAIYGIIFGGAMDVIVHISGNVTGLFSWTNYGPFGFKGIPIFANVSWAVFFILYFYFLPKPRLLVYIFAGAGVFWSVLYFNLMIDVGILESVDRLLLPLVGFTAWYAVATWGFYKLKSYIELHQKE